MEKVWAFFNYLIIKVVFNIDLQSNSPSCLFRTSLVMQNKHITLQRQYFIYVYIIKTFNYKTKIQLSSSNLMQMSFNLISFSQELNQAGNHRGVLL